MPPAVKYSVVLPCYNERENIPVVVWLTMKELNATVQDWEIIIIDDSSPDGTADVVRRLQKEYGESKIVLRSRPAKLGLGSAYQLGTTVATGDFIVFMDADLSHQPKYLPAFIRRQQATNCDIVTSTRYTRGGGVCGWDFKRKLISRGANILAANLFNPQVSDLTGAYRMYRRDCLLQLLPLVTSKGYGFQMEIIIRARYMGFHIEEEPIIFVDRLYGCSKLGGDEIWMWLWGLIHLLFKL